MYYWAGLGPVSASVLEWIRVNTKLPDCEMGQNPGSVRRLRDQTLKNVKENFADKRDANGYIRRRVSTTVNIDPNMQDFSLVNGTKAEIVESSSIINAEANVNGTLKKTGKTPCVDNSERSAETPWETQRDSAAMVHLWRTQMPSKEAVAVWEICEDLGVMFELGYEF